MSKVDQHLDDIGLTMFTFKNPSMLAAVLAVLKAAYELAPIGMFWPDEVDTSFLPEKDKNCVGIAFRLLSRKFEVIEQLEQRRRSSAKNRSGGVIFAYRLTKPKMAISLLRKHGMNPSQAVTAPPLPGF